MGPVLFALAVDPAIRVLGSPLNLWFLDDGTLAGPIETTAADLYRLIPSFREIGLEINTQKCETTYLGVHGRTRGRTVHADDSDISRDDGAAVHGDAHPVTEANTGSHFEEFLSIANSTSPTRLTILGVPIHTIGHEEALANIQEITRTLMNRTANIGSHAALFFLSRYTAVFRATYLLRTAPVYTAGESLRAIDEQMREATSRSCNVHLADDSWTQASLPLRFGSTKEYKGRTDSNSSTGLNEAVYLATLLLL